MAFNINGVSENYTDGPASLISRLRKQLSHFFDFRLIELYLSALAFFFNV